MTIANEEQLFSAMSTGFPSICKALVIAPHPDDEVFGCGGTLVLLQREGTEIRIVIATDGALGGDPADDSLATRRAAESCAAAAVLGLTEPIFWDVPDRGLIYGEALIEQLTAAIRETEAELVFLPSPTDWHPDHQALAFAGAEAVRRLGGGLQAAFYEVTDPLPCPNLIHDISAVESLKLQAMQCFVSQLGEQPYAERIAGINRFRAMHLGARVASAEAFHLVTAAELDQGLARLLEGSLTRRRTLGFAASGSDLPLVSVIIRSMDRPTLDEALDSVALQTWPNIEVVLVNAKGPNHRPMPATWGRLPLRVIGGEAPLQRSRAANLGLDAARGEYLMFLDDDDWFEADHVAKLVDALQREPQRGVAYGGVRCVNVERQPLPEVFDTPFNTMQLMAGNFIPMHAALFSRTVLASGCRLDESLEVYEDWDFWIQLSRHGAFLHVPGTRAVYRIGNFSGFGVNADPAIAQAAADRLYRKWFERLGTGERAEMMHVFRSHPAKDRQLAENETRLDRTNQALGEREREIETLTATITELQQSVRGLGETATTLTATLATTVAEHEHSINELAKLADARQQRLMQLEHQATEQVRIIDHQKARIDELLQSTSWRVTQPLRSLGWQWRKVRGVTTVARRLLARESLPTLARRAWRVLRREGFNGVRARVRQQHLLATQAAIAAAPIVLPTEIGIQLEPAALTRDPQGRYALAKPPGSYTYVAPRHSASIDAWIAGLVAPPRFAVVVPVYNTPPALLNALVASVEAQWYPHWQLVLADDASPSEATRSALAQLQHPGIKVIRLDRNQGISGATNAAINAIDTDFDFVVFVDHDDEITVDCLYELARCIERDQPDFIYSDEDKITAEGDYGDPHFKPDWSPDTMMSTMFTCHVSCIRRSVLAKVGGLRSQFDGCQDWDFVLRVSEQTARISHIPRVLYHWRVIPGSTAADIAAKSYILDASRAVREDALRRRGLEGRVEAVTQVPGYFRVVYALRGEPLVSIIIPTRDNAPILRRCIDSIERLTPTTRCRYEIIVMDNGSLEPTSVAYLEELKSHERLRVVRHDAPFNFSELNNLGVRSASGDLLLFLNDDTEILQADWLERLGGLAQLDHVGSVGAKLLFPSGSEIQHAGVLNLANGPVHAFLRQPADMPGYFMRNLLEYDWLAVTGACLMIERRKFEAVGGFCETLPVAYNDIDLCMRLVAGGYYNVVCPAVRLIHHESASRGLDAVDPAKTARLQREMAHLYERNPAYFQRDPFHNPNLHPNGIHFEVPA